MISKIPHVDRPRERCLKSGGAHVSLRECLALILGTGPHKRGCLGLADEILARCIADDQEVSFFRSVESSPLRLIEGIHGLGPAGKARLLASFELAKRYSSFQLGEINDECKNQGISNKLEDDIQKFVGRDLAHSTREWIGFIPVRHDGGLRRVVVVENGTRSHVNFDPADLFSHLLTLRPPAVILIHNHPSGYLKPSDEDLELTSSVQNGLDLFDIDFWGHWIIGPTGMVKCD